MFTEQEFVQIRRHGLTADDKARIAGEQDGCALCGRTEPGRKGWVVDHDRACCNRDRSCLDWLHPSHVWQMRQSTDRSTGSLDRDGVANPTDGRDVLTKKSLTDTSKSDSSVPRARVQIDHELLAENEAGTPRYARAAVAE